MKRLLSGLYLAALITSGFVRSGADARTLAEIYGALPLAATARLSPNGDALAMISGVEGREMLVVSAIGGGQAHAMPTGAFEPKWFAWKSDTRLLAGLFIGDFDRARMPIMHTRSVALDADGRNAVELKFDARPDAAPTIVVGRPRNMAPQMQDQIVSFLPGDPDHILAAVTPEDDYGHPDIRKVDIHNGTSTVQEASRGRFVSWLADPSGDIRLAVAIHHGNEREIFARTGRDASWNVINKATIDRDPVFNPLAFSATEPSHLYVQIQDPDGHLQIGEFDISSGNLIRTVAAKPKIDASPAILRGGRLVGYWIGLEATYIDPDWDHDAATIRHALPERRIELIDRSADGKRVLVHVVHGNEPPAYWLLDRRGPKTQLSPIAESYPDIQADQVAPTRFVTYAARDGLPIPALITLPAGYHGGPLPFIVLPHGGPTAHDPPGFQYWPQFLARLGYGVMQPQFRGSTGYGIAFQRAGFQQWGLKMQDDVTDGTRWLIAKTLADPKRICIVGGSYGGYAALMGLIKEPDLYRCGAALAPVTDLDQLVANLSRSLFRDINLPRIKGEGSAAETTSPVDHADRIKVPVLLVHGEKDFTVSVTQSRDMERALRRAGKPVEAHYLETGDHYLSRSADRTAFLQALQDFLQKHLGS